MLRQRRRGCSSWKQDRLMWWGKVGGALVEWGPIANGGPKSPPPSKPSPPPPPPPTADVPAPSPRVGAPPAGAKGAPEFSHKRH